jgi:DNA-binding GntR family transcriptional regulator
MSYHKDLDAAMAVNQKLHHEVARDLLQQIRAGRFPIGSKLPSEPELGRLYAASRYAVREAVQSLEELGVVKRRQGIGTEVLSSNGKRRYVQQVTSLEDLFQYAVGTRLAILTKDRFAPSGTMQEFLSGASGTWLRFTALRWAGVRPISYSTIYISPKYDKLPRLSKSVQKPLYFLIEQRYGVRVTSVEQEIFGAVLSGVHARHLKVSPGTAGLRIVRRFFVGEDLIEVTDALHPAERFSYSMSVQLDDHAGLQGPMR